MNPCAASTVSSKLSHPSSSYCESFLYQGDGISFFEERSISLVVGFCIYILELINAEYLSWDKQRIPGFKILHRGQMIRWGDIFRSIYYRMRCFTFE